MKVVINRKEKVIDEGISVAELLKELNFSTWVFVSVNGEKLLQRDYGTTILCEGDIVKVIKPLAGG